MKRSFFIYLSMIIVILTALLLPGGAGVQAAPGAFITVNNTNDSGFESLRAAVAAASAGDTINFSVSGTITLTSGHILIDKDLTISGPGAGSLAVSGNSASRIFTIAAGKTVAISGLYLENGLASGNHGGAIYNSGTLAISSITFSSNSASLGGGIYNNGIISVTKSFFFGNSATSHGGGIYNSGTTAIVSNSTFSSNSATDRGGGIYNHTGAVTLSNSTLSGNSASASNGGGIGNWGTLNYANTIIAYSSTGGDCVNNGTLGTDINNLVEDGSCSPTYSGDPKLISYVPQGDSPVIDAGDAPTCAAAPVSGVDQRGQARNDLRCDIGAIEVKLSDTGTITKLVSGAGTYTFGPTLVQIDVTAPGSLSQIEVQHHSGDHPNATRMDGQWWGITPTGAGFTANLNLPHTVSPDTDANVCKHVAGSTWDCARTDSSATRVWRDGLTAFSDWAVGDNVSANAITLRDFAAQAGGGLARTAALAALLAAGLLAAFWRRRPAQAGQGGGGAARTETTEAQPFPAPPRAYTPPAISNRGQLKHFAGSPLAAGPHDPLSLPGWDE